MRHSPVQPTAAIRTQGCKLNQADSEALARRFIEAGYQVVDWAGGAREADVLVLNTCTVTAVSDAKARQALRAAHRANEKALIVVTGCYAERAPDQLSKVDGVSLVVGNTGKEQLVAEVTAVLARKSGSVLPDPDTAVQPVVYRNTPGRASSADARSLNGRTRAMIKIQEGCDQVCAYCIVPKVRGRERSVPPEALLQEINQRVEQGCREIVLTGTQLGTYGFDLTGTNLFKLLRRILDESAVPRLRVSSLQAQEISPELLALWENPRLCPHFHIPLQSGCDRILRSMRRRYDASQFARSVDLVHQMLPDAGVTTDLIVGFPGEGEDEYQESRRFARSMHFSDMHIFPFSPRPGTSAAHLQRQENRSGGSQQPDAVKKARAADMIEVAYEGFRDFRLKQLGRDRAVLWESSHGPGDSRVWSGLTDNYVRVRGDNQRDLANLVTGARLLELAGDVVNCRVG